MNQIICPNCGAAIPIDESAFEGIVRQVRDEQFAAELAQRQQLMEHEKEQALQIARQGFQNQLQGSLAERDAKIAQLEAALSAARDQQELASRQAATEAASQARQQAATERDQLVRKAAAERDQLVRKAATEREEAQRAYAELQRRADALEAQLARQDDAARLAQTQAVAQVERERDAARSELAQVRAVRDSERQELETRHALELEQVRKTSEELIRYKDDEIERLRDMKARLSTKMVGESLEQHCETEFNRLRMTAFPRAYFEKDNDASAGSKGDYIFRELDEDGNEIVSIMFEMKNENDTTATKHKNADFFKKLDHDRAAKGCEYAVLVSLLEPESELYNAGIVDVSYQYPKMYVIRPQFFIPMITLLRNAAMNALAYKQELARVRQQNVDVTNFEEKLEDFQGRFQRNCRLASDRFDEAIKAIDKGIKDLQTVREKLLASEGYVRRANDNAQGLTIRKLTRGNATMKAAFAEAREARSLGEGAGD